MCIQTNFSRRQSLVLHPSTSNGRSFVLFMLPHKVTHFFLPTSLFLLLLLLLFSLQTNTTLTQTHCMACCYCSCCCVRSRRRHSFCSLPIFDVIELNLTFCTRTKNKTHARRRNHLGCTNRICKGMQPNPHSPSEKEVNEH